MSRPTFVEWASSIAEVVATRSEDPYVQVGSVICSRDWTVLGVGYNGLPAGVDMPADWWAERDERRPYMIHAEVNALRSLTRGEPYRVVSTHIPCAACMSVLGSYQIGVVYYRRFLGEAHDTKLIRRIADMNRIQLFNVGDNHGRPIHGDC